MYQQSAARDKKSAKTAVGVPFSREKSAFRKFPEKIQEKPG